jgi:hypothetical protein
VWRLHSMHPDLQADAHVTEITLAARGDILRNAHLIAGRAVRCRAHRCHLMHADRGLFAGASIDATCACRKLNPAILVMQSAQDWATKNVPGAIDGARDRSIFLQG